MSYTSLEKMNKELATVMYDNSDKEYVLYLFDHYKEMLANSEKRIITIDEQAEYKYRLRMYLKFIQYPHQFTWYILWLNDLDTEFNFVNVSSLMLPKQNYIENTLWTTFKADRAYRKKANFYI
jgi:hypothetical protein